MTYLIWFVGIYLAIGVVATILLSQTPYADNAWWKTALFWPLFVVALIAY